MWVLFLLLSSVYSYKNHIYRHTTTNLYNHKWYVIGEKNDFEINKPKKIIIKDTPISIWKDEDNQYAGISDICPHRGASLSKGRIDKNTNCIVCPYHTFKFNKKGRLVQTPGKESTRKNDHFNLKTDVAHFKVKCVNDWVYMNSEPIYELNYGINYSDETIWTEPEAYDNSFRSVQLKKKFNIDARTVTENSLDILHISEVHSFGNRKRPLPINEIYERIDEGHYKVMYEYVSGEDSMAAKVFKVKKLIVENEYILPHYTIARVKFGDFTNTIVTSALPLTENSTMLYVKAYRNNWVFNIYPLDIMFDKMTENMMEKTLNEDKSVIDTIYSKYKDGNFITKYDELTKIYRDDYKTFINDKII